MAVFRSGCVIFLLEYFIKISFVVITDGVHNLVYGFIRVFRHGFRMFQTDLLHIECSITGRYRYTNMRSFWKEEMRKNSASMLQCRQKLKLDLRDLWNSLAY